MTLFSYEKILKFWFGDDLSNLKCENYKHKQQLWFKTSWDTDELIKKNFLNYLKEAENGKLDDWKNNLSSSIALIILFDQFSRNVYRGTANMFKNDHKAIPIANELLTNPDFEQLSLIEKFFVYLTLLHSEDLKTAEKGLDGIQKLLNLAPESQKGHFYKYFNSSKTHLGLLVKYGRYPHRNLLLNRESNEEELEFLQRSKHNFVKSVNPIPKPLQPTNFTLNENEKETTKRKTKKVKNNLDLPFQRVLFLHGFRQGSNKIKKRTKKLAEFLKNLNVHITYLNGTHPYVPQGEVAEQIISTFGEKALNPIEAQRVWYNSSDDASIYKGIDESIEHILIHVKSSPPYDGIVGFGQGSALAAIIVKIYPHLFRYFISISGFEPRALKFKDLFSTENLYDFPSLHIYGKNDILITPSRSEVLAKCFMNSKIAPHSAGHFAPDYWPLKEIGEFVMEQTKSLKPIDCSKQENFEFIITKLNFNLVRFKIENLNVKELFRTEWASNLFVSNKFKSLTENPSETAYDEFKSEFSSFKSNEFEYLNDKLLLFYFMMLKNRVNENLDIILRLWIDLYLNNSNYVDYLINDSINILFIDPQNWKELIRLCDVAFTLKSISNETSKLELEKFDFIYQFLIEKFYQQLVIDLSLVDRKNNSYLIMQLTSIYKKDPELVKTKNMVEERLKPLNKIDVGDYENFISDLAQHFPRIKSSIDKRSRIGRECANKFNEYANIDESLNPNDYKRAKIISYNHFRKILSAINLYTESAKESLEGNTNPKKFLYLARHDKNAMDLLMSSPLSDAIVNPVPEQVDVSPREELQPLYDWIASNQVFNEKDLIFLRGKVTTDGRLDLCKQVIGPQGIKPLLDSMESNKQIKRLLLGNNIVGDKGGQIIADFIKSGKSPIRIWYIAGNHLTVEGIKPICESLLNDNQVTGLWLKRNPLKAAGMVPIGNLLTNNNTIEVLDLLNCGLLDEGVKILFEALKLNSTLKHLYLNANGITTVGLNSIKEYYETGKSCLVSLFLGCNRIGNEGAKIIGELLKHDNKLERLNVASSRIGADGMKYLCEAFKIHPSLKLIDLGYTRSTMDIGELGNYIEDEGALYLSEFIENSTKIMSLNITHNHISQKGMEKIVNSIKLNKSLLYMDYIQFGVNLNEVTLTHLRSYLQRNRELFLQTNSESEIESIIIPDHVKEIYSGYRTH